MRENVEGKFVLVIKISFYYVAKLILRHKMNVCEWEMCSLIYQLRKESMLYQ